MSNPPNLNRYTLNRNRSSYSLPIIDNMNNTMKSTLMNNGSKLIQKEHNNIRRDSERVSTILLDAKIKDLESKLSSLEKNNQILIERIANNERNFSFQIKQLQVNNIQDRENIFKTEKVLNNISEQNNANSNDINMKLNILNENLIKGNNEKIIQRQNDLESQKYLISKLTEKITKTVKSEVEARYKADIDTKIFSQKINNKFENSLDILKKDIEEVTNSLREEIQNISKECSERTHNVSKYIDQQITEALYGKGSAIEELKNFVKKLTEQIKSGFMAISEKNKVFDERIDNLAKTENEHWIENHKLMNDMEQSLIKKMKNLKKYMELNILKHDKYLEENIEKITSQISKNIEFIGGQLIDTRNEINKRFQKIFYDHKEQFGCICDDMTEICNRVYKYEDILKEYLNNYTSSEQKINKVIADSYSRHDIHIIQERIIRVIECNFMQEEISKLDSDIKYKTMELKENLNEFKIESRSIHSKLKTQINEQNDRIIELADKTFEMIDQMKESQNAIEVNQIVQEMVYNVDNAMIVSSLQRSKNTEYQLMDSFEEQKYNLKNAINEINNNKTDIYNIKINVSTLEKNLAQTETNLNKKIFDINYKLEEIDRNEGVNNTINNIVNNVENLIHKSRIDKLSQYDFDSMIKTLSLLDNEIAGMTATINNVDSMQKDIQKLYQDTEELKNKSKGSDDIKIATMQMIYNVEFENIYSILRSGNLAGIHKEQENINLNEIKSKKIIKKKKKNDNDNNNNDINLKDKDNKDSNDINKQLNQENEKNEKNNNDININNDNNTAITKKNGGNKTNISKVNNSNQEENKPLNVKEDKTGMIEDSKKEDDKLQNSQYNIAMQPNKENVIENGINKIDAQNANIDMNQVKQPEEQQNEENSKMDMEEEEEEEDDEEDMGGYDMGNNNDEEGKLKKNEDSSGKSLSGIKK